MLINLLKNIVKEPPFNEAILIEREVSALN